MQAQLHQSGQRPCSELNKLVSLAILYIPSRKPQNRKFLRLLYFFIFLGGGGLRFAASCKMVFRRGRSFTRSPMSQTKVTVHPYKSFGQACLLFVEKFERQRKQALPLSKACGNPKGKARGRLRRGEIPQRILTNKAK